MFYQNFIFKKVIQSTHSLRPIIPNNAYPFRITAAAGTKLAGASSLTKFIILINEKVLKPIIIFL